MPSNRGRQPRWTPAEDAVIRASWRPHQPGLAMGLRDKLPGRSIKAIHERAGTLGLTGRQERWFWTAARDAIPRRWYGILSERVLAQRLGTSAGAIGQRAIQLRLRADRNRVEQVNDLLIELRATRILLAVAYHDLLDQASAAGALALDPTELRRRLAAAAAQGAREALALITKGAVA